MLRMDGFRFLAAQSAEEAVALWHSVDAPMYVAGGTDLLPNIKHRIFRPQHLIGLAGALPQGWSDDSDHVVIGAGTTLSALTGCDRLPPLAAAASVVAGPQIRNMGTLGGNILLDTRCLFYNQSEHWRKSLGYCLKAEGDWCHVIDGPKTCVATQASDTVPVLLALNASIRLLGPDGTRDLALRDLYRFNGMDHLKINQGELLTHVLVPKPATGFRGSYQKLRQRGAIDFPQLAIAVTGTFEGVGDACTAPDLCIVVGAINPQPKMVSGLSKVNDGPLTSDRIDQICRLTVRRTRPQASMQGEPAWRRQLAGVFVGRALRALRDGDAVPVEV